MPDSNVPAPKPKERKEKEPKLREKGTPPTPETVRLLAELRKKIDAGGWHEPHRWSMIEKAVEKNVELDAEIVADTVKWFKEEKELDDKESDFSLARHLVELYNECPFFAEVSRWVRKVPATRLPGGGYLPTAAMCYNLDTDDFELRYNRRWFASLTPEQVRNVIVHEMYHLVWRHITTRRRSPNVAWNIATDLAINSIIINSRKDSSSASKDVYQKHLPGRLYLPTVKPDFQGIKGMLPEEKMVNEKFADLIAKMPEMKASEAYFADLLEFARQNGWEWGEKGIKIPGAGKKFKIRMKGGGSPLDGQGEQGEGDGDGDGTTDEIELDSGDVHDMWDDVPEEVRDLIEGKVKGIVERAVRKADNASNGWGNIPSEIVSDIRASVLTLIDWRALLRNFVGMTNRGNRTTTMKKINKRFPYVHPGSKRGYAPHVLMAVDMSGSVDDASLEKVFGVLRDCSRRTTFTVLPFDHSVDEKNLFVWKRGQTPKMKRTRCGGTSFQAVIDYVNKPENRGKWDGVVICTDGECSAPSSCRVKKAWVIVPGRKLLFETKDIVINMDSGERSLKKGAVR